MMAEKEGLFVKIWCSCFRDLFFKNLSCIKRGLWLQLPVYAKENGDTGLMMFNSMSEFGDIFGLDARTAKKILAEFEASERVILQKCYKNAVHTAKMLQKCSTGQIGRRETFYVFLANYVKNQQVKRTGNEIKNSDVLQKCSSPYIDKILRINTPHKKSAGSIDNSEWQMMAECLQTIATVDKPNPVLAMFLNRQKIAPGYLMFSLLRLKNRIEAKDLDSLKEPMGMLRYMLKEQKRVGGEYEGGDSLVYRENIPIAEWYSRIFPDKAIKVEKLDTSELTKNIGKEMPT